MSAETSEDESDTPPEPQTDDFIDHEEDTSNLLDVLRSIPGTQVAYDDDEPSGDEAGQCECKYDCPVHQWLEPNALPAQGVLPEPAPAWRNIPGSSA